MMSLPISSADGMKNKICMLISNIHTGQMQERPKPVVIIEPDKPESVTVRCKIPGNEDDWTYSWFTEGLSRPISTDKDFSMKTGRKKSDGQKSEISDTVSLNVSFLTETPKPVLTVQPELSQIFRGVTVTLTCDIQGHTHMDIQMAVCQGCRGSDCSEWSDTVTLTVFDKPRVTVKPQSSVFTGDTVTLSCDVGRSTGLSFIWYKDFIKIKSGDETHTLSDVGVSDAGKYGCSVGGKNSTTQSPGVMLTVRERPKAVVRVQPDGRVFRGQTITLTCDIQETDVTSWNYTWNKDDSVIHESQSQEYRISSVNESHTGNYSCRGRETDGSRYSHTSDEVTLMLSGSSVPSGFHALIIGVTAGLSVFLLIFLLVLLWRCKHNKGGGSLSPSTDHQQHNIRHTEEQKSEQTPPQSDTVIGPSDVTYVEIDLKSVKGMKKKKEHKGAVAGSSDMTNAQDKIRQNFQQ
ncbi:hypothetical protein ABG768_025652 [Culter alburnus]|uniref:Ig-like domain-containing protein n=1 Tax=Culter alburnus TaxID=194366 RepID=A0AAW2AIF8_CULAL